MDPPVMTRPSSRSTESLVYSPNNDETTRVTTANHKCHTDHGGGEMDYMMPGKRITTVVGFAIIEGFTNTCSLLEEHTCTYINTIAHIVHQVGRFKMRDLPKPCSVVPYSQITVNDSQSTSTRH